MPVKIQWHKIVINLVGKEFVHKVSLFLMSCHISHCYTCLWMLWYCFTLSKFADIKTFRSFAAFCFSFSALLLVVMIVMLFVNVVLMVYMWLCLCDTRFVTLHSVTIYGILKDLSHCVSVPDGYMYILFIVGGGDWWSFDVNRSRIVKTCQQVS